MKEVRAYIKPEKLTAVTLGLHDIEGLSGMSVVNARGFGRGHAREGMRERIEQLLDHVPNFRVEIICSDDLVTRVVEMIKDQAYTGLRGDGKIYIAPVEDAIRISTGEHGDSAI